MFSELKELIKNSYSPKSKYAVACIVKMKDGKFFKDKVLLQHKFDGEKIGAYGYVVLKI